MHEPEMDTAWNLTDVLPQQELDSFFQFAWRLGYSSRSSTRTATLLQTRHPYSTHPPTLPQSHLPSTLHRLHSEASHHIVLISSISPALAFPAFSLAGLTTQHHAVRPGPSNTEHDAHTLSNSHERGRALHACTRAHDHGCMYNKIRHDAAPDVSGRSRDRQG
jgi:hypothetical protein